MMLCRFVADDIDALFELDNDAEVMRFINNGAPVERSVVAQTLESWLAEYDENEHFGCWAAIHRPSAEFLGWFHLRTVGQDADPVPELGYRLRRQFWGLGLATEGSRALIDRAFSDTRSHRVRAETMAVHTASRRVMERCGMHLVRTFWADWPFEIPGSEHGDVEYAIDRTEWHHRRRARGPAAETSATCSTSTLGTSGSTAVAADEVVYGDNIHQGE
ncbi:MAG: GNAT family N-acetyltransferase [Acidimicrobiales bacterium]